MEGMNGAVKDVFSIRLMINGFVFLLTIVPYNYVLFGFAG